jgi:hypothetical protein
VAFLRNKIKQVTGVITNATTVFCNASIESIPARLQIVYNILNGGVNDNSVVITYTLSGGFWLTYVSNILNTQAGRPVPTIDVSVLVDGTDLASILVGDIQINWPEDGAGSANMSFKPSINPFSRIPTLNSNSPIEVGAKVVVNTTETIESVVFNHTIFTGRIVDFAFSSNGDVIDITCVDMSYDVSRPSNRVSNDFFITPDNIHEESIETTIISPDEDSPASLVVNGEGIGNHEFAEIVLRFEVLGEFHLFDANDVNSPPFDYGSLVKGSGAVISERVDADGKWHLRVRVSDLSETVRTLFQFVKPPQQWVVMYGISDDNVQVLINEDTPRKSEILRDIAKFSGIEEMNIQRALRNEDERVFGNITANREFPLDFIRKIIVPQTWKALYDEYGVLQISRETLSKRPYFTFDEAVMLDNSVSIRKNTDDIINRQEVSGVVVSVPTDTTGSSRPSPHRGLGARHVILAQADFDITDEFNIPIGGLTPTNFTAGDIALQILMTIDFDVFPILMKDPYNNIDGVHTSLRIESSSLGDIDKGPIVGAGDSVSTNHIETDFLRPIRTQKFIASNIFKPFPTRGFFFYGIIPGKAGTYVDPLTGNTFANTQWEFFLHALTSFVGKQFFAVPTPPNSQWFDKALPNTLPSIEPNTRKITYPIQVFRPMQAQQDGSVKVGTLKGTVFLTGIEKYFFTVG